MSWRTAVRGYIHYEPRLTDEGEKDCGQLSVVSGLTGDQPVTRNLQSETQYSKIHILQYSRRLLKGAW